MPSFDNTSDAAYDAASNIPISDMNHAQCNAEKLRMTNRVRSIRETITANIRSGMDPDSVTNRELEGRITRLRNRFREVDDQMRARDARDRAVAAQNAGHGSTSRNRSSQSPPAPRAPNSSPQH
ncbi:hypothetical protein BTUL_0086g00270 [Botrytis tulipae]|uniref:Syntaxin N-terminal domain-containing protein n=1 Tax=Botrytis tulipae TaxID=87230 RepID=A0A4Z1EP88_9HELO|nr:hypothetical protein BTUL_0086g00270 [Botrytis tulipae]